jgi:hypothetical protein
MRIGLTLLVFIIATSALAGSGVTAVLSARLNGVRPVKGPLDP